MNDHNPVSGTDEAMSDCQFVLDTFDGLQAIRPATKATLLDHLREVTALPPGPARAARFDRMLKEMLQ